MSVKNVCLGALLLLALLAAYLPAVQGGYVWDDDVHVTANPTLRTSDGLRRIWLEAEATPQYYPLVFTTFWLEYHAWGPDPLGYHIINVLLHGLNALLVWLILRRLRVPGSWLAGALFAFHPVHVESVAWITERKNVLSGFFYLCALLAWLRFRPLEPPKSASSRAWPWYLASLLLFAAALLSKTVTCSLPAVLLILMWWRGKITPRDLLALAPFFALGLVMGLNTAWLETHHIGAAGDDWSLSWLQRCLIAGRALWFYLGKLLVPVNLTFIYPRWDVRADQVWQYFFPLAALATLAVLFFGRARLGKGPAAAALFFAGTLFPALGFFNTYPMRFSFVADHFQYLASLGLIVPAAAWAATIAARRSLRAQARGAMAAAILLILAALSWQQATRYRDEQTLWQDTLAKNPECWIAHGNLGLILFRQGDINGALEHYARALQLHPRYPEAQYNMGLALSRQGRLAEALEHLRAAASLRPDSADTQLTLGAVCARMGAMKEAAEHFSAAARIAPGSSQVQHNLGQALEMLGDLEGAAEHLASAVALDPGLTQNLGSLGWIRARQNNWSAAAEWFRKAVAARPAAADLRFALGLALTKVGKDEEAAAQLRDARRVDVNWPPAASQIAWMLATHPDPWMRDAALALQLAQDAATQAGDHDPLALDALAAALAESGRYSEAASTARRARLLAAQTRQDALAGDIQHRESLYAARRPYRDDRLTAAQQSE